jgi:hypothetical protein
MSLALQGAIRLQGQATETAADIIRLLGASVQIGPKVPAVPAVTVCGGERDQGELRELARACWALALFVECHRSQAATTLGPLAALCETGRLTLATCLGLATTGDVEELTQLAELGQTRLLPQLRALPEPCFLGPVFAGSRYAHADGDLVAGGLLLEVKTNLGGKTARGERRPALESANLSATSCTTTTTATS